MVYLGEWFISAWKKLCILLFVCVCGVLLYQLDPFDCVVYLYSLVDVLSSCSINH